MKKLLRLGRSLGSTLLLAVFLTSSLLKAQSSDRVRVYLVVDVSGSMAQTSGDRALRRVDVAAKELLERAQLAFDSRRADVQLIFFDDVRRRKQVGSMDDVRYWADWMVRDCALDGLTNLWDTLYEVAEDIEAHLDSYRYFYVATLTDGIHSPRDSAAWKYRVLHKEQDVRRKFIDLGDSLTEKQGIGIKVIQWGPNQLEPLVDLVNQRSGVPEDTFDPPKAPPASPKPAAVDVDLVSSADIRFIEDSDASIPRVALQFRVRTANIRSGSDLRFEVRGESAGFVTVTSSPMSLTGDITPRVELQLHDRNWLLGSQGTKPVELVAGFSEPGKARREIGAWTLAAAFTPGAAFEARGPKQVRDSLKIGESSRYEVEVIPNRAARGMLVKVWFSSEAVLGAFEDLVGWQPFGDSGLEFCRTFDEGDGPPLLLALDHRHDSRSEVRGRIRLSGIGYPSSHDLDLSIETRNGRAEVTVDPDAPVALDLSPGDEGIRIPHYLSIAPLDHAQDESVSIIIPEVDGIHIDLRNGDDVISSGSALPIGRSLEFDLFVSWNNTIINHEQVETATSRMRIQVAPVDVERLELSGTTTIPIPTITSRPHFMLTATGNPQMTIEREEAAQFPFHVEWNRAAWESLSSQVVLKVESTEGKALAAEAIQVDPAEPVVLGGTEFDDRRQETRSANWVVSVTLDEVGARWSGNVTAELHLGSSIRTSEPISISTEVPDGQIKTGLIPSGSDVAPNTWTPIGKVNAEPLNRSGVGSTIELNGMSDEGVKFRFKDLETGKILENGIATLKKAVGAATEIAVEVFVDPVVAKTDAARELGLRFGLPEHTRLEGLDPAGETLEYKVAIPEVIFVAKGKDLLPGAVIRTVPDDDPEMSASIREGVLSARVSCPPGSQDAVLEQKLALTVTNTNDRWKSWVKDYYWVASGDKEATIEQLTRNAAVKVIFEDSARNNLSDRRVNLQITPRATGGLVPVEVVQRSFVVSSELPSRWSTAQVFLWLLPVFLVVAGLLIYGKIRSSFTGKILVRPAVGSVEQILDVPLKRSFGLGVSKASGYPEIGLEGAKDRLLVLISPRNDHIVMTRKSPTAEITVDGAPLTEKKVPLSKGARFSIAGAEARYVAEDEAPREVEFREPAAADESEQEPSFATDERGTVRGSSFESDDVETVDPLDAWGNDDGPLAEEKEAW